MKKSSIFLGVTAAILFTVGVAQASSENMANMEKCKVVKNGKGMIKEGKAACKTVLMVHVLVTMLMVIQKLGSWFLKANVIKLIKAT